MAKLTKVQGSVLGVGGFIQLSRFASTKTEDNKDGILRAIKYMKANSIGKLIVDGKFKVKGTLPLDTGISYTGLGKSTTGFIFSESEVGFSVKTGTTYSPEIRDMIIQSYDKSGMVGVNANNANQLHMSNVQITGFSTGLSVAGRSYYANFERVRVLDSSIGVSIESGSRGITFIDVSTDSSLCNFQIKSIDDNINNITLINPKAEKVKQGGCGFKFITEGSTSISGFSVYSGRFDPDSNDTEQSFITLVDTPNIRNIVFDDITLFHIPAANYITGEDVNKEISITGTQLGFGVSRVEILNIHDAKDKTQAGLLKFYTSTVNPRIEATDRKTGKHVGIRVKNIEAMEGVIRVRNPIEMREPCISVDNCTYINPLKLGSWYLWFSEGGSFRKKKGLPLSDGDGEAV